MSVSEPDPLAQVTMTPRVFAWVLAVLALLTGLVLALVPVQVAGPDPLKATSVTCGNPLGGVETPEIAAGLGGGDRETRLAYIGMCDRALSTRGLTTAILFFGGLLAIVYLGTVRTVSAPASPGSALPPGPPPA